MASNNQLMMIQHFADPHHSLLQTQYRHDEAGLCNMCLLKLAGLSSVTYGCYTCNIHLHSACARYFQETISFFAHRAHTLRLRRSPGRVCDICREDCPPGSFVYSCTGCGFDVHPLCSMLPERVASPLGPSHQLCMCSSEAPGSCSACHHPLPRWHYIGSSLKLHVACAIDTPTGAAGQGSHGAVRQRSFGAPPGPAGYNYNPVIQGYGHPGQAGSWYWAPPIQSAGGGYGPPVYVHGIYYVPAMPSSGSGQQSIFNNPTSSLMSAIATFLARNAFSAVASDLLSELLPASFN